MKKLAILAVLFSFMTISAQAQWFDFSENMDRSIIGFHFGPMGYNNFEDLLHTPDINIEYDDYSKPFWDFSNFGYGMSITLAGLYFDFSMIVPDHKFDKKVGTIDWRDHSAFYLNAGYQIPFFENIIFFTPIIGFSRVTTGVTKGDEIGVDPDSYSWYHEYQSTWHRHEFNYGLGLTIAPSEWFELYASCTKHGSWVGIGFNLMTYQN